MSNLQQSLSEAQALLDADKLDELSTRLTKLKVGCLHQQRLIGLLTPDRARPDRTVLRTSVR